MGPLTDQKTDTFQNVTTTDLSKLEEIKIPDISQEVSKVDHKDDGRLFLCQCGDAACGFTAVANNMARSGLDDQYITSNVGAYRVR